MLNEEELSTFCLKLQLSRQACKVVQRVRNQQPSRRVASRIGNVSCRFPSRKMRCVIQAESHTNELAALYEWEHDPKVHEFYDQPEPIKLSYINGNGRKVAFPHTPDYFLIAEDFVGWVECKNDQELRKLSAKYPERFRYENGGWFSPPGEAFAARLGLRYRIRAGGETDWILTRNLRFLEDYLLEIAPAPTDAQRLLAAKLFARQACWSLYELLHADPALPADAVYQLIADGHLYVDLSAAPLADPAAVSVYRDVLAADCLRTHTLTRGRLPVDAVISFEPGTRLVWNDQSWKVAGSQSNKLELVSAAGELLALSWETVNELCARGDLKGAAPAHGGDVRESLLAARIAQSSPAMLETAKLRLEILHDASRQTALSVRTLRTFRKRFREAEASLGNGFVGLIDHRDRRGNRQRKIDATVIELMHQVLRTHYFSVNQVSIENAYGELLLCCEEQGLTPPSLKTFARERCLVSSPHEGKLLREGSRAAYTLEELVWDGEGGFPPHGERPFDIAHIDHTEVDLMLRFNAEDKPVACRVWLSVLIDAYSRMVLAYYLTFDPPNFTTCMMLVRNCVQRHGRLPSTIVVDGGKEFGSEYFEVLLASFAMTKKTRPPHSPRFGSVMERLFGVLNKQLWHNLRGNTKPLRDPRSCSSTHDPRRLAVWTLDQLEVQFERWLKEVYEVSPHSTLQASPRSVYEAGLFEFGQRHHLRLSYTKEFVIQCLPAVRSTESMIHPGRGVLHFGIWYWCEAFRRRSLSEMHALVRYDPFDLSTVYAHLDGEWHICRCQQPHLFAYRTEREMRCTAAAFRLFRKGLETQRRRNAKTSAEYFRVLREDEEALYQATLQSALPQPAPVVDIPDTFAPYVLPDVLPVYGDL
ncbi:DDE-type integrase/transposase/recombinase [Paludibacterium sp. B53371]|uniref:DDE-type integrase/transposase/recombinase n=1 Tax=Paludibacterium sp. B53371 TaxID=2806263 RepID=UPI001C05A429|nr:DDE-type integrase/transposase/recombinase [Paludibacterium sp. B53371]